MGLVITGLHVRLGSREVLRDVSLAAAPGEILGLYGGNGAGKSTLLRTVAGLVRRERGEVLVAGRDPDGAAEARAHLAYLPETPAVTPHLSGKAHIDLVARLFARDPAPALEAAKSLGLAPRLSGHVGGWSQGMRQKLMLCLACLGTPGCVLLDDPLNALDPPSLSAALGLIRKLADAGAGVLLAGQRPRETIGLIDSFAVLHEGRLNGSGRLERGGDGTARIDGHDAVERIETLVEAAWN